MSDRESKDLVLRDAGERGRGVFARRPFARGETALSFGGPVLPALAVTDYTHALQIGPARFLGPSGDIDDYVNHSCDPTCGLRWWPRLQLVVHKPLAAGDELTFDYSACMLDEPTIVPCRCGAPTCRGRIDPFRELPAEVRDRLVREGVVPDFVRSAPVPPRR